MSLATPVLEVLPKVEQLSSRVIRILGLNPGKFTLQGTNTYVVGTGRRYVIRSTRRVLSAFCILHIAFFRLSWPTLNDNLEYGCRTILIRHFSNFIIAVTLYLYDNDSGLCFWCSRILIDTGEADKPEYVSLLKETLQQHQAAIHHVLITHRHHDHIGGLEGVYPLLGQSPKVSKVKAEKPENIPETLTSFLSYLSDGDKITTEGKIELLLFN